MTNPEQALAICIGAGVAGLLAPAQAALAGETAGYASEMQVIRGVPGKLD